MIPQQANDKKLSRWCLDILPIAKAYVKYAAESTDINLKRDSLKRLLNTYLEIHNVPANSPDDIIVFGTVEKLESLFKASEIEQKEASDPSWMRQYARARARQVFIQLKEYSAN